MSLADGVSLLALAAGAAAVFAWRSAPVQRWLGQGQAAQPAAPPEGIVAPVAAGQVVKFEWVSIGEVLPRRGEAVKGVICLDEDDDDGEDGSGKADDLDEAAPTATPSPPKPSRNPRRSLLGGLDPSVIPPDAGTVTWESKHLFSPYGHRPTRHSHGLHVPEPPLAMVCPECDARRTPMGQGQIATCEYCGVTIVVYGSLVHFWWVEEIDVAPWAAGR